jgi:hypothetical protein
MDGKWMKMDENGWKMDENGSYLHRRIAQWTII